MKGKWLRVFHFLDPQLVFSDGYKGIETFIATHWAVLKCDSFVDGIKHPGDIFRWIKTLT